MNEFFKQKDDYGKTILTSQIKIPKSDSRFSAIGVLDELSAAILVCKNSPLCDSEFSIASDKILAVLDKLKSGVAYPRDKNNFVTEEEFTFINELIAVYSSINASEKPINDFASLLNLAKAVARRAEREVVGVDLKYGVSFGAVKYLDLLSKYLDGEIKRVNSGKTKSAASVRAAKIENSVIGEIEKIVRSVVGTMDLQKAKKLAETVENEALKRGAKIVVAVYNEHGNPICVHAADGAFLVSFDVAMKKAYTAVALKMPTIELARLTAQGETFYGLQNDPKLSVIGGGVPIVCGGKVIGGLGVSGGTGEEDHSLCEFALKEFFA